MKLRLTAKSPEDLDRLRRRIPSAKLQLIQWQAIVSRRLFNEEFLDIVHQKMQNYGFSKKIIDRTYIDTIDFVSRKKIRVHLVSDYISESGFDVSKAREEGTKDHFIGLKVKTPRPGGHTVEQTDQTRDIPGSKQRNHPRALSWISMGNRFFSGGHWVTGIPNLYIIDNTIKERANRVRYRYHMELLEWLQKNFGGELIGHR